MVAPIASGHAGRPVKLRAEQRGIGSGDKSIVRPDTNCQYEIGKFKWFLAPFSARGIIESGAYSQPNKSIRVPDPICIPLLWPLFT